MSRKDNSSVCARGRGCTGSSGMEAVWLKREVLPGDGAGSQGWGCSSAPRTLMNGVKSIQDQFNGASPDEAKPKLQWPGFYLQDLNAHPLLFSFPLMGIHCPWAPRGPQGPDSGFCQGVLSQVLPRSSFPHAVSLISGLPGAAGLFLCQFPPAFLAHLLLYK